MELKSVRLIVTGRVQGVWYRGWTVEKAQVRGLDGWVRNRIDGSVEAVLSGPERQVDEMIDDCREGPPMARVMNVEVEFAPTPNEPGFRQLPTHP